MLHLLRDAGFSVLVMKTATRADWMHWQFIHSGLRNAEGERSPLWDQRATRQISKRERFHMRLAAELRKFRIFSFTTKLLDAFGIGDNLIIEARPIA